MIILIEKIENKKSKVETLNFIQQLINEDNYFGENFDGYTSENEFKLELGGAKSSGFKPFYLKGTFQFIDKKSNILLNVGVSNLLIFILLVLFLSPIFILYFISGNEKYLFLGVSVLGFFIWIVQSLITYFKLISIKDRIFK